MTIQLSADQQSALNNALQQAIDTGSTAPIDNFIASFSASATDPNGVLYSGKLAGGTIGSGDVAPDIANQLGSAIIDDTARGQLLSGELVDSTGKSALNDALTAYYTAKN